VRQPRRGPADIFIRRIREFGFEGAIYPIHPAAAEIDGLPAYRTLADTRKPSIMPISRFPQRRSPPCLPRRRAACAMRR